MLEKPDKFIPALYGGIIIGVISSVPFLNLINCLCCAGIMLGGFLSIYFYKENFTPDTPPFTTADCVSVGLYAGIIGAFIGAILDSVFLMIFGNVVGAYVLEFLQNMELDIPDEALESIEQAFDQSLSAASILIGLISGIIINSIFGVLGGLIGFNIFKPKPTLSQSQNQLNV